MLTLHTLLLVVSATPRPLVTQQITWMYARKLSKGAGFLTSLGFTEVNGTKQASFCRIFHAAPSHYLGVCDSRPAPTCPDGPEGTHAPPLTYTIVVPSRSEVNAWHEHLVSVGEQVVRTTSPGHSSKFAVYAFNFYDVDRTDGLGCYRLEVQSFEDPAWPPAECPPIEQLPPPQRADDVLPPPAAPRSRVMLDLYVASKCPDAPRCERMLEPMLRTVGALVDVRLSFIGQRNASAVFGANCLHGPSECAGNVVQLCTQAHWPYHVNVEVHQLPAHLNWLLFLKCAAEDADGQPFNHTALSLIPQNTRRCLQRYSVPSATADKIDACVHGAEGAQLLGAAIDRTHQMCGHHSSTPGMACKSCSMFIDGRPTCVLDDGRVYNCSGLDGGDPQHWIARICAVATAKGWSASELPLACRVLGIPRVHGHSYASTDPKASADFAQKYFGAALLSDQQPACGALAGETAPREVSVRLPHHRDYRGGGLILRFVHNPRKPGGKYDVAAHVAAMSRLFGNLSDNTGHHWNQFFDSHLGFYARPSSDIARDLLRDGVPFFTGQSSGVYQSIYVTIPGTGHVVEVLGNWYLEDLPPNHVRFSSTDQFCSPKRRRLRGVGNGSPRSDSADLGINYLPGDADLNKTTMAGADPRAAIDFAQRYLGGSAIQQHRGPMGDGPCTTLSWAEWPDQHQWHFVRYDTADWVTLDGLRPAVPFNVTDLASYVEDLRDLEHGTYDQWLDFREIMWVHNLTALADVLRADKVAFSVWARPPEGTCSLYVNLPGNGIAVELVSRIFDGQWLSRRCAAVFDLCAAD